jgi:hypothetical protein
MNEYYSDGNNDSQRQYTMCHEMGHGFGLPHTDENFYNKDLGNCMDYTVHPEVNMQPATANFNFLAQLYGTVDGSPVPVSNTTSAALTTNNAVSSGSGNRRNLSGRYLRRGSRRVGALPPQVEAALEDIDLLVDNGTVGTAEQGWRLLHKSAHGEAHEIDLGNGFTIQIHLLKFFELPE